MLFRFYLNKKFTAVQWGRRIVAHQRRELPVAHVDDMASMASDAITASVATMVMVFYGYFFAMSMTMAMTPAA